jgi:hypothetical protein
VFRRRSEAPPPPPRNGAPTKPPRELGRPRAPPPGKSPGGKKGTGGLTEEESKVVDELEADFEAKTNGREK